MKKGKIARFGAVFYEQHMLKSYPRKKLLLSKKGKEKKTLI
jgi:hypothetical protein